MTVLLLFSFLSGIVTILSPCILPVLPIVLSGGIGGKRKPYGVIIGFIASFSVFTLILTTVVQVLGIPPNALRFAAVVLIVGFGLVLLIPKLRDGYEALASKLVTKTTGRRSGSSPSTGFTGGIVTGASLGLIWTPCVGPIMASVISLAVTRQVDGGAVLIILAYSLGTSLPMLGIMLGGRGLFKKVPKVQRLFGALMILVGLAIGFGWDRQFQSAILDLFPGYGSGLTAFENTDKVREAIDSRDSVAPANVMTGSAPVLFDARPENGILGDFGPAPELVAGGRWFNTDTPFTMDDLRGKVVIVDFWTYSCVNCVRTLPYLRSWYEAYADEGLVIIGVHTPEFAFEQDPKNVLAAIEDLDVTWPVVLDNDYAQWRAYNNRYWPAHYFIDATGRVRYYHFGEGEYDTSESVIRKLLEEAGENLEKNVAAAEIAEKENTSRTPETYLGYARTTGFSSSEAIVPDTETEYRPGDSHGNGEWSVDGRWTITREYATAAGSGVLELGFDASHVYLVVDPGRSEGGRIEVLVDNGTGPDTADITDGILRPDESRLYELVALPKAGDHVLKLRIFGDLKLYAFTFG